MVAVDLTDVQGFILRGYTMPVARHLGLLIREPAAARSFLAALTGADPALPAITNATPWAVKPECCVNLGITAAGLSALGVAQHHLDTFPDEFVQGAAARAERVGDVGSSAPDQWLPWLTGTGPHLLLSLFAQSAEALDTASRQLERGWFAGCVEAGRYDGEWLPGNIAHFGYRDGLSQPTVEGVPMAGLPDHLPRAPVGEFLLGYPSQHPQFSYPVPSPPELGSNGSFAAFRILEQDVHGFETFLAEQAGRTGLAKEFIAAKLCGRWRNGVPLVLSPDTDTPDPPIPPEALNDFDYVGGHGDQRGYRCPVGSHIRRMHPRGQRVVGNGGHLHRIVRRGIPYGPPYDPANPADGKARGLLGLFIGVSLADQFEFLMSEWANDGRFTAGLGASKDPLLGATEPGRGSFSIPHPDGDVVLEGFSRFITTRGGAYCFLPGISAIRHLAALSPAP